MSEMLPNAPSRHELTRMRKLTILLQVPVEYLERLVDQRDRQFE